MSAAAIPGDAKSRMERILLLQEQIDAIKADIREIYAEEKAAGGDKTAMGAAISYIRKREKDGAALAEREAMADVYVSAYDAPRAHTHTREARSYADAKLVETVAAGVQTEIGRTALTAAIDAMLAVDEIADPETGEIIETQESAVSSDRNEPGRDASLNAPTGSASDEMPEPHSTVAAPPAIVEQPEAPNTSPATSGTNLTRPAFPAVSGDEPGIPSSAADGAKTDGAEPAHPGRADLASDHRYVKAEQVANSAPVIGHVSFATSSHINPDDMPEIPAFLRRDFERAEA